MQRVSIQKKKKTILSCSFNHYLANESSSLLRMLKDYESEIMWLAWKTEACLHVAAKLGLQLIQRL